MTNVVLKIEFKSDKSFDITLVYIDERLLSDDNNKEMVNFYDDNYNFLIYSRKTLKKGANSIRLPSKKNYKKHMKDTFTFKNEKEMYNWLKLFSRTLDQCKDNFTPFTKDKNYHNRAEKLIMSGEYWII